MRRRGRVGAAIWRSRRVRSQRRPIRSRTLMVTFLNTGAAANNIMRRLSGHEGDAGRRAAVVDQAHRFAVHRDPAPHLRHPAEQAARQIELAWPEEAVEPSTSPGFSSSESGRWYGRGSQSAWPATTGVASGDAVQLDVAGSCSSRSSWPAPIIGR